MDSTELYGVLADRNRRRILDLVTQGERTVSDLIRTTRLHQPLVSHHLRVLRQAGLVATRKEGRFRMYRVTSKDVLSRLARLEADAIALLDGASRHVERPQESAARTGSARPVARGRSSKIGLPD